MLSKQLLQKKVMVPVIALTVAGATFFGVSQFAHAQSTSGQTLVQMIAQTFGLDQSKVQAVFDKYRSQHQTLMQANMQNRLKTHLDQLVQQGKITSAQEQAIINEMQTLRSQFNPSNLRNMTPQQRQQAFQQHKNAFDTWAKSQGIDPTILQPLGGMGMHHGWRDHDNDGMGMHNPATTPTPAQ